jgi:hypothetical protein
MMCWMIALGGEYSLQRRRVHHDHVIQALVIRKKSRRDGAKPVFVVQAVQDRSYGHAMRW